MTLGRSNLLFAAGMPLYFLLLTPAVGADTSKISSLCARQEQVEAIRADNLVLTRLYVSKFAGIALCAPAEWSIEIEDESIFLAPSVVHQFWESGDASGETIFSIGRVSPFLSPGDLVAKRTRNAVEIAHSTANSLTITEHAKTVELRSLKFANSRDGASLLMKMGQRFQYQVILGLESGQIVTVSVSGRRRDQRRLSALVDAIAETIRPLPDEG